MKNLFLIFIMALTSVAAMLFGTELTKNDPRFAQFEKYLTEINQAYHIPGMAFVLTTPEETVFSKTFGQCKSLNQQFFIGSMSKSYTALCTMQLVEKALINLDDDISVYLPQYKFEKPVTVLSLLNHTSGFDTHMKLADGKKLKLTKTYGKYEYANVNYDLLGKIIETVSGLSYDEFIAQNVFAPLGMNASSGKANSLKDSPDFLTGNRNFFGFFKKGEADYPVEESWFHEPAGYIATTPNDHAKYLRMYLNGGLSADGNRIIKKESIDSMWYENVSLGVPQYDAYYGRGWNFMNYDNQVIIFHGGQVETGITYQFILPEEKLAVCFMINANDEFGMNNLVDSSFWNSLKILKGEEPDKVNHASYFLIHGALDLIYVLILALSVFILIRGINGHQEKQHSKPQSTAKKLLKISLNVLGFIVWPVFLLTFTTVFVSTPLWVVKQYVPDFYGVLITSSILSVAGGASKLIRFKNKKTVIMALIVFLTSGALFAEEPSFSLSTVFGYYPASEMQIGTSGSENFAPITGPYAGLDLSTTLDVQFKIDTPLGEHWLLNTANVLLIGSFELTPVSVRPKISAEFTPLPFFILRAGGSVGLGWNFPGIEGLCEFNTITRKYETLSTFEHPYYELWAGAALQFDTGALIPGDWSHVLMFGSFTAVYSGIARLNEKTVFEWQCSKGRVNGLAYEAQGVLAYQMPLVLKMAGVMVKSVGYFNGSVYGEFDVCFDGKFPTINISPVVQFEFGKKDQLVCFFEFSSRRSYEKKIENDADVLYNQVVGREWYFQRISLCWTHTLR